MAGQRWRAERVAFNVWWGPEIILNTPEWHGGGHGPPAPPNRAQGGSETAALQLGCSTKGAALLLMRIPDLLDTLAPITDNYRKHCLSGLRAVA